MSTEHLYGDALAGFAFVGTEQQARWIARHPWVEYVEEDGVAQVVGSQVNPPWGLDRIDNPDLPLDGRYRYSASPNDVEVFVIDTGIRPTHAEFARAGGSNAAVVAGDFIGGNGIDCHGHGTHVASTIAGNTSGVAKGVVVQSLRVLDCAGSGPESGVVAAVDYAVAASAGHRAVMNLSLGGPVSQALDDAIRRAAAAGVVPVVAAGNSNEDAGDMSPAHVAEALTVGASTSTDARAFFSNYGAVVDLFAPGTNITGAGNMDDTSLVTMSGTSMATPHVAGAVALYLQGHPTATTAQVINWLTAHAAAGRLSGIPAGTVNRLLQVGEINGAAAGSISVPALMHPGRQYVATVTFTNTGVSTWTGSTSTARRYFIGSQNETDNTIWGLNRVPLPATADCCASGDLQIPTDRDAVVTFPITAPLIPGTYSFQWQMIQEAGEWFGAPSPAVSIQVGTLADDAAFYVQSVPPKMQAGQPYHVSVSYANAGTATWSGSDYVLRPVFPSWGVTEAVSAQTTIQPGGQIVFNFSVSAPTTTGPRPFQWRLVNRNTNAQVGDASPRTDVVVGTWADDAQLVAARVPARMRPGQPYNTTVTFRNRGTSTWTPSQPYFLGVRQKGRFSFFNTALPVSQVRPGEDVTFAVPMTAPPVGGVDHLQWQMLNGGDAGFGKPEWFGDLTNDIAVHVADWTDDAAFERYQGPTEVAPGAVFQALVTFRNTGSNTWNRDWPYWLATVENAAPFEATNAPLPIASVAAGQPVTVPVNLRAPATLGTYLLSWQFLDGGAGAVTEPGPYFGEISVPVSITVGATGLDVASTSVTDPPALLAPGAVLSVSDTVRNLGDVPAAATVSRYYLSLDTQKSADDLRLSGSRSVPALAAGLESSGTVSITIPTTAPTGTYTLFACADDTVVLAETNESNNCLAAAATLTVGLPDLVTTTLSIPSSAVPGTSITLTDTAQNIGAVPAAASNTRYYLSQDASKDASDILLNGTRSVPALAAGAQSAASRAVTIPATVAVGIFRVLACADDTLSLKEASDTNNCFASPGTVVIAFPDLVEIVLGDPPAYITPGAAFTVTDTVQNQGQAPAATSATRYYLSADAARDAADVLLSGTRSIAVLAPDAASAGSRSVTVPTTLAPGTYTLLACADDLAAIKETSDANNCVASSTPIVVAWPDLVEASVSGMPASSTPGAQWTLTDTVRNVGQAAAGSNSTRYYLSVDGARDSSDVLMSGTRSVPGLVPGAASTGARSVVVPTTVSLGTYLVVACADDTAAVKEQSDSNNCIASAASVLVTRPDLVPTSVTDPPAMAAPGSVFAITDSVLNNGQTAAAASTTRYYLSLDGLRDGADVLVVATRSVPALGPGTASAVARSLTVPPTIPEGTYRVIACADDLAKVVEMSEANNCAASAGAMLVGWPDLLPTSTGSIPAEVIAGVRITVSDTVTNQGNVTAVSSTTVRYYLSVDTVKQAGDVLLSGSRSVPVLTPGASSTGSASVAVPVGTAPGAYYVLTCADDLLKVGEQDEANNCRASASQIVVR